MTRTAAGSVAEDMALDEDQFRRKYGVGKPQRDSRNVVVYCLSGVRSGRVLNALQNHGARPRHVA